MAPGGPFFPFRDPVNPLGRTDFPWVQSCLYDKSDEDRAQPSGGLCACPAGRALRPPPRRLSSGPVARGIQLLGNCLTVLPRGCIAGKAHSC